MSADVEVSSLTPPKVYPIVANPGQIAVGASLERLSAFEAPGAYGGNKVSASRKLFSLKFFVVYPFSSRVWLNSIVPD